MKKITYLFACIISASALLSSCNSNDSNPMPSGTNSVDGRGGVPGQEGRGGSMARFTISGNNLYTVDHNSLTHYDISNPNDPKPGNRSEIWNNVETIFPYQDKLFIGTQGGMIIMSIQNPAAPVEISRFSHILSCDPVVADSRYAYVTLSTGTTCQRAINELQIVDLANISDPKLVEVYPMVNPKGLGIDGKNLFVCDNGLKHFDATNVNSLVQKHHFPINAFDVIPHNGNLMVIGSDGLYQYSYQNEKLEQLSKLSVQKPI